MKPILLFYLTDCGYCNKAHKAIEELCSENPEYQKLQIKKVEENEDPDFANKYDYYATPTFYVGDRKSFEAHIGMSYDDIKSEIKRVFNEALHDI